MTPDRRYALGVLLIAVLAGLATAAVAAPDRATVGLMALLGLLIQGPLGWVTVRAVGSPSFLGLWGAGLVARFGLVAVAALVLVPLFGLPATPALLSLVGVLVGLLAAEAVGAAGAANAPTRTSSSQGTV